MAEVRQGGRQQHIEALCEGAMVRAARNTVVLSNPRHLMQIAREICLLNFVVQAAPCPAEE